MNYQSITQEIESHLHKPQLNQLINEGELLNKLNIINQHAITREKYLILLKKYHYYYEFFKKEVIIDYFKKITVGDFIITHNVIDEINKKIVLRLAKKIDEALMQLVELADKQNSKLLFIAQQEQELQSPLLDKQQAQQMIPHRCLIKLIKTNKVRCVKYQNQWLYAKNDLALIAKEEQVVIRRINKIIKSQRRYYVNFLDHILKKIEVIGYKIKKYPKISKKILTELDEVINKLESAYQQSKKFYGSVNHSASAEQK